LFRPSTTPKQLPMFNWPFPPPGGPIPWTRKQERDYQTKKRDDLPTAPF
jgi:hypothetical protein